jgi:murein DD-endopeptidase / murein LD-carboxypeptidase
MKLFLILILVANISFGQTTLDSFINEWKGTPYRLGGRSKSGIDCSQFTKRLYKDVYNKQLDDVAWKQWNQTKRTSKDSLEIGDIVFFSSKTSPSRWHCGIYIGNNKFVHSSNKREGVKVSDLNEHRYIKSYKGAGRF